MAGFQRKLNDLEEAEIFALHVEKMVPYRQVAQLWNQRHPDLPEKHITHSLVVRVVKKMLDDLAEQNKGQTHALRQKHQLIIENVLRIAYAIAAGSKCVVCSGDKTVAKDRLDPDLGVQVCPKCDGSGRNEDDATRLAAIGQIRGLLERHAKVFGIDAPIHIEAEQTLTVALDVAGLSDDALGLEAAGMFRRPILEATAIELAPGSADSGPQSDTD